MTRKVTPIVNVSAGRRVTWSIRLPSEILTQANVSNSLTAATFLRDGKTAWKVVNTTIGGMRKANHSPPPMDAESVAAQIVSVLRSPETVRRLAITPNYSEEDRVMETTLAHRER